MENTLANFGNEEEARKFLMREFSRNRQIVGKSRVEEEIQNILESIGENGREAGGFDANDVIAAAQQYPMYCEVNKYKFGTGESQQEDPNKEQTKDEEKKLTNTDGSNKVKKEKYDINNLSLTKDQTDKLKDEVKNSDKERIRNSQECKIEKFIYKMDRVENLVDPSVKAVPVELSDDTQASIEDKRVKDDGDNDKAWAKILQSKSNNENVAIKFSKGYGKIEGIVLATPASTEDAGRASGEKLYLTREKFKGFLIEKTLGQIDTDEDGVGAKITSITAKTVSTSNKAGVENQKAAIALKFFGQKEVNEKADSNRRIYILVPQDTKVFDGEKKTVTLDLAVKITNDKDAKKPKTRSMKGKVQIPTMIFNPDLAAAGYEAPKNEKVVKTDDTNQDAINERLTLIQDIYAQAAEGNLGSVAAISTSLSSFVSKIKSEKEAGAEKVAESLA